MPKSRRSKGPAYGTGMLIGLKVTMTELMRTMFPHKGVKKLLPAPTEQFDRHRQRVACHAPSVAHGRWATAGHPVELLSPACPLFAGPRCWRN